MKRFIGILLVSIVCCSSLKGYDFKQDNLFFTVTDATQLLCAVDKGDEVYSGDIIIPSTVSFKNKELKVTSIKNNAFRESNITSIQLSNNMRRVERFAFYHCSLLTKVIIPSSINKIEEGAFDRCYSLRQLIFEDGSYELEFDESYHKPFFSGCPLEEIYIGRNITHFITEYCMFGDLSNLNKVTIGESVTIIPSYCFANATSLSSISIPGNIKTIREAAFNSCTGLKYIEFQDSPNPIMMYQSTIGSTNYTGAVVNYSIFSQSPVQEVYIGRNFSENTHYYHKNDITLEYLPLTKVTIGKYVTELTSLNGCRDLLSISIPSNVNTIKNFKLCTGLRKVIVDSNIPPAAIRFSDETYVHGVLYVPKESIETYAETTPWSSFWEINNISYAGIDDIKCDIYDSEYIGPLYTISGILLLKHCSKNDLKKFTKGLYIWKDRIIQLNN